MSKKTARPQKAPKQKSNGRGGCMLLGGLCNE